MRNITHTQKKWNERKEVPVIIIIKLIDCVEKSCEFITTTRFCVAFCCICVCHSIKKGGKGEKLVCFLRNIWWIKEQKKTWLLITNKEIEKRTLTL